MYRLFSECQQVLHEVNAVDFYLAKQLCQHLHQSDNALLFHLIMLVCDALHQGHSCVELSSVANQTYWQMDEENGTAKTTSQLTQHGYCFASAQQIAELLVSLNIKPEDNQPLVFEFNRLYLRRYWYFEQELASYIKPRLVQRDNIDLAIAKQVIGQLFPLTHSDNTDWQKVAVSNALNKSLAIIAGGPGTGKTTTVTKLLAGQQMLHQHSLTIAMAAPTGKAAQRLNESIIASKQRLLADGLINQQCFDSIESNACTIHRLLGVRANSHNFHHNQTHQLTIDILLLDEISMIDLPLMTRVFRALPAHCKIILLGDADQLPSVAAGSILADVAPCKNNTYSQQNVNYLCHFISQLNSEPATLNFDHVTTLQHSYRFKGDGGIGQLAKNVINGEAANSWQLLATNHNAELHRNEQSFEQWLHKLCKKHYQPLFTCKTPEEAFELLAEFKILSATRQGDLGIDAINQQIHEFFVQQGLIKKQGNIYPFQPIMITENNHKNQLFNGDIGIIWPTKDGLLAAFTDVEGNIRFIAPGRLPAFETVYAMTIHKTQGSEFSNVALVLPTTSSAILSRELLYTGITRAKKHLSIHSNEVIWRQTVQAQINRYSGLAQRLFG